MQKVIISMEIEVPSSVEAEDLLPMFDEESKKLRDQLILSGYIPHQISITLKTEFYCRD